MRVAPNIHIRVDECYYSVPYVLVKKEVEVRLTAPHRRGHLPRPAGRLPCAQLSRGHYTTLAEHMPEGHQRHLEWTPQRLLRWAGDNGPHTQALIQAVLESRPFPQQAFNACLGIMRLGKSYGMHAWRRPVGGHCTLAPPVTGAWSRS